MVRIETRIRTSDPDFQANRRHHEGLAADLRRRLEVARTGGPEELRRRHTERGKLLARERIEAANRAASYHPRAYVVEGERKKSVIFGPFISPPRAAPRYLGETPRKPASENAK